MPVDGGKQQEEDKAKSESRRSKCIQYRRIFLEAQNSVNVQAFYLKSPVLVIVLVSDDWMLSLMFLCTALLRPSGFSS